jgi:hypothetical protein
MTKGASAKPINFFDLLQDGFANWINWDASCSSGFKWPKGSGGSAPGGSSGSAPDGSGGSTPGGTGETTKLTVTFNSEEAGYANSMGWYNARTGEAGILFLDLNDDGWKAGVRAGDTRSITVLQSDVDAGNIGFFMIPNGANEFSNSTLSSPMRFQVGSNGDGCIVIDKNWGSDVVLKAASGDVLFSNQVYNKNDYDYVSGQVGTAGQTTAQKLGTQSDGPDGILGTMAWDDQMVQSCGKGSDRDFNDVVFTVSQSSTNPPSNRAPTDINLSNASINENAAGGVVGTLSTVDPDASNTHSYTVSDNRFEVVNGQLKLKSGVSLDYESASSVQVKITTTDQGGLGYSEDFAIAIKNVNEVPTDISLSNLTVNENASGAVIGKLSTIDPDAGNTHGYTVSDSRFEVVNGELKLKSGVSLDFESQGSVQVKVATTDQGGLGYSESFSIAVKDVNESPTKISLSNLLVDESEDGALIGKLSTSDPDAGDSHQYSVDDQRFEVVGGQLWLKEGVSFDHETDPTVTVKVTSTDLGGKSVINSFVIGVTDLNEAPSAPIDTNAAGNLVLETAAIGTTVGITASAADPDAGDALTYSLTDDAGGLFAIDPTTGVVTVAGTLDHETASQHTITVRATDTSGEFSETDFDIQVADVAQVAVDGYIAGATVFADANGNGVRDAGETYAVTGAFGAFDIDSKGAPLVMVGGYDIATGESFQGKLTAQAGSTVITPLTTLVVELGKAGVPSPTSTLAGALGLTGVSDFGQLDPIASAPTSINAFARSSQVFNTVTMAANLITGANAGVGMEGATAAIFAMLAAQAADGTLDLSDTATLEQLISDTVDHLGLSGLGSQLIADAAAVIGASNGAIDAIVAASGITDDLLTQISAVSIVAQGDASLLLKLAGQSGESEELVGEFTGDGLASQLESAANQVGNLYGTGTAGTKGDDAITGTNGADIILGDAGKDTLSGGDGNDQLYGGTGDDILNGGNDEDRLFGGAGNNVLNGGLGADTYLHSGTSADGDDTVNTGENGFDRVVFSLADLDDLGYAREGNDLVIGATHAGGSDFDGSIRVVDHYAGSSIAFVQIDTSHNLDYGANPDVARFFFTTDLANGLTNSDAAEVLFGGDAGEVINGNGGYFDAIFGGGGNDVINGGGGGVDNLYGGAGNDQLFAGAGDDLLSGGAGDDVLDGGAGIDTFLFDLSQSGTDTLVAFDRTSDVLSFTNLVDKGSNGVDLTDLLSLVSAIQDFGVGGDVVVDFTTGAQLVFQGAGTGSTSSLTSLVANQGTQIHVA